MKIWVLPLSLDYYKLTKKVSESLQALNSRLKDWVDNLKRRKGLKGLQKTFWGTTMECENKYLS